MNMNNAYKIYEYFVNKHTPVQRYYDLIEAIYEAAHALLQRRDSMRLQKAENPVHVSNLATMWDTCWENTGGIKKGRPPFQCSPESDLDFHMEPNELHIMVCLGRPRHPREL